MKKYRISDVKDEYLLRLLEEAYEAMASEAMYCPWCTGYIGGLHTNHEPECVAITLNLETRNDSPTHPG